MTDIIISPPEPVRNIPNIPWKNDSDSKSVFDAIQQAKNTFTVEVEDLAQATDWENILNAQVLANGEDGVSKKALNAQVGHGEQKVTIAIIGAVVMITGLLNVTSLIAYGLSRGYSVTGKKNGNAFQFKFTPKKPQVSYTISAVVTSSSPNFNEEDDLSCDAIITGKDNSIIGTLKIIREPE
jgi:hypothetical protein